MDKQQDGKLSTIEAFKKLFSRPARADAGTQTHEDSSQASDDSFQTPEDLSQIREDSSSINDNLLQGLRYASGRGRVESILGFERSEEPDQDELNAEITEGHWRCYLKRLVRLDRGPRTDLEFYRDRRPINASWNGVALSRPFAPWESTDTSNHEGLDIIADPAIPDDKSSFGIDKNAKSIYHLYRTIYTGDRYVSSDQKTALEPNYHLEIKSPLIIELLRNIVLFHPAQDLDGKVIIVPEPYMLLWQHHRALRRFNEDVHSDEDTKKHLQVLIGFLDSNSVDAAEFKGVDASGDQSARITYRNAWYLYRPGAWLLCRQPSLALSWMSIVESIRPARKGRNRGRREEMRISYRFVRYNGSLFEWCSASKSIKKDEWSGNLADAEFVPVEYIEDQTELFAGLRERGRKYWYLQGQHLKGQTGSQIGENQEELDRVIVDEATYQRMEGSKQTTTDYRPRRSLLGDSSSGEDESSSDHDIREGLSSRKKFPAHRSVPETCRFTLSSPAMLIAPGRGGLISLDQLDSTQRDGKFYLFGAVQAETEPEEVVLMSCQQEVNGFSLRQKRWRRYNVNDLGDVRFRENAFSRLVLNESYKDILRTMIEHHTYQRGNQFKDLVEGKGQGLIILLHGPPGVGKTLAAESIADLYQRPLYSLTSGDVGSWSQKAEKSIRKIFDHAVTWKAIILMDEADIFLAQRTTEDTYRNELVSVFLRNLEYFDGIMVLTTNRVGVIDEAFQSRLDVALALEPLTVDQRKDVWFNFIDDLSPQISQRERDLLRREVETVWSHKHLNGRQIRNCIKTASVLAKQHGENVSIKHIRTTIKTVLKFTQYMQKVHKMDEERRAEMYGIRNHLAAKATDPVASSGKRSGRTEAKAQRGRRSSSLEMEAEDDEDLGSDI